MTEIPVTIKTTEYIRFVGNCCNNSCYYGVDKHCNLFKSDRRMASNFGNIVFQRDEKCLKRFGDGK